MHGFVFCGVADASSAGTFQLWNELSVGQPRPGRSRPSGSFTRASRCRWIFRTHLGREVVSDWPKGGDPPLPKADSRNSGHRIRVSSGTDVTSGLQWRLKWCQREAAAASEPPPRRPSSGLLRRRRRSEPPPRKPSSGLLRKKATKRAPAKKAVKRAPAKKATKRAPAKKAVKRAPAKEGGKTVIGHRPRPLRRNGDNVDVKWWHEWGSLRRCVSLPGPLKLSEARSNYQDNTRNLSAVRDNSRSQGIAIVWIFKVTNNGSLFNP